MPPAGSPHAFARRRYTDNIVDITTPYGTAFCLAEIEAGLQEHKPDLMWIAHAETSTGVLQPMEGIGELCQKYNCLLMVDTVTSICGIPVTLDDWKVQSSPTPVSARVSIPII